ncbi:TIR domain-containing protein [Secundilactobacillus oryzae]|nr:TIR domain-containing protein [Secundilactobacillus oryzae]
MSPQFYISMSQDLESNRALTELLDWLATDSINYQVNQSHLPFSAFSSGPVRRKIRQHIRACDYFLVIISQNTYKSNWVNWEIEAALRLHKPLLILRVRDTYITPDALYKTEYDECLTFSKRHLEETLRSLSSKNTE